MKALPDRNTGVVGWKEKVKCSPVAKGSAGGSSPSEVQAVGFSYWNLLLPLPRSGQAGSGCGFIVLFYRSYL